MSGLPLTSSPPRNRPSSRSCLTVWMSCIESMSKTFFAVGVVAELLMVAGEAEHVIEPEGRCAEEIALQGDPVPVAADHLHDRVEAHLLEKDRGAYARHPDHARLVVRDVDAVHIPLQIGALLPHHLRVRAPGRAAL